MTIIPDLSPTAIPRQRLANAALARLLSMPLPEMASWQIGGIHDLPNEASLAGHLTQATFDVQRTRLHQWASALDNAIWAAEPWCADDTGGQLLVRGTFMEVSVEIWTSITAEQLKLGVTVLAELDEQPADGA